MILNTVLQPIIAIEAHTEMHVFVGLVTSYIARFMTLPELGIDKM